MPRTMTCHPQNDKAFAGNVFFPVVAFGTLQDISFSNSSLL